ncbi:MAG TPA: DUF2231 domain-containing protein [Longimicrobiales bacterium]|nr:DUF2231 domain-containing protein [Longimicrobiales bacterium]
MIPNPLHPAIVHFPIVLMFLVPMAALVALWSIRRGAKPLRAWAGVAALAAALSASALLAKETGEQQQDRVEHVVAERAIHTHEEAADLFFILSLVSLGVVGVGLAPGRLGTAGRVASTVAAAALVVAGWRVGASGGELVYRDGAAQAYVSGTAGGAAGPAPERHEGRQGDRDDDGLSR